MAIVQNNKVNEFEGTCPVAWVGEELKDPIKVRPVMDDSSGKPVWYSPTKETITGKWIFSLPKSFARHVISTQPDRWKLMGIEKMTIRVLNKDHVFEWKDFYPWDWRVVSNEADPDKKGEFITTYGWVEKKDAK
jgi:hypothetical protein